MGSKPSSPSTATRHQQRHNGTYENRVSSDRKSLKILLLGTSDSGKSTIVRQLKVLYQGGFSRSEKESFVEPIRMTVYHSMTEFMKYLKAKEGLWVESVNHVEEGVIRRALSRDYKGIYQCHPDAWAHSTSTFEEFGKLWGFSAIQRVADESGHWRDSTGYFLDRSTQIGSPSYLPHTKDILKLSLRTTGIYHHSVHVEGTDFDVYETSGARSERKKWARIEQNADVVIFCAALSEYDQFLKEDLTVHRLHDSIDLFESIANHIGFGAASIILLLTKPDVFHKKLEKIPLSSHFPEYSGGNDFKSGLQFIKGKFLEVANGHKVETYIVDLTDSDSVKTVLQALLANIGIRITKDSSPPLIPSSRSLRQGELGQIAALDTTHTSDGFDPESWIAPPTSSRPPTYVQSFKDVDYQLATQSRPSAELYQSRLDPVHVRPPSIVSLGAFDLPDYGTGQPTESSVLYSFTPTAPLNNSLTLLPPPGASDALPRFHIAVTQNVFNPLSHITTVYRGDTHFGDWVASFEMGISNLPGRVVIHGWEANIATTLASYASGSKTRWSWKPPRQQNSSNSNTSPFLSWDYKSAQSPIICRLKDDGSTLLATFKPAESLIPFPPVLSRRSQEQETLSTLEVTSAGLRVFEDVLVSLLIIQRKRMIPEQLAHSKQLFS